MTREPASKVRKEPHPNAKKGLERIRADGSYVYRVKIRDRSSTSTVRFGVSDPPVIKSSDGQTTFSEMYGSKSVPTLLYDYEWQPLQKFGRLGIQAGFGFLTAQGSGRFKSTGEEAREKYTFIAVPLNLGAIYRLEFMERQWLAPYIAGGGTYFLLAELRDDEKRQHFLGTAAGYGAGGMMFNISRLNRETALTLDSEYGIANLWLTAEYRRVQSVSQDLDMSSNNFNVGISVDY